MAASIALINMPFAAPYRPSIQCGLLKSLLVEAGHHVEVFYLNLDLVPTLSPKVYLHIAEDTMRKLLGEWLFAEAAFGPRTNGVEHFAPMLSRLGLGLEDVARLRREVLPAWIEKWSTAVEWSRFQIVGFSCTYQQTTAAIALARRIKAQSGAVTLFGGSAFDARSGREFVKHVAEIDYLLLGEADRTLPEFATRMARGEALDGIPGLLSRADLEGACAPEQFADLDSLPDPDYGDYFRALENNESKDVLARDVRIPFQSSRGCWWGQHHHCTFCGVPQDAMRYRRRSPDLVLAELNRQARRHRRTVFTATDNILDLDYLKDFFPQVAASRLDYTFFYETKANLKREQIRVLVDGGVRMIQPGIESLSTPVLRLMNKGTTMALNVRLLKWSQYYGLRVAWNVLTGFPGETLEDYTSQIRLAHLLRHLPPPTSVADFLLERSGTYPCQDNGYFRDVRPMGAYSLIYPPEMKVDELANCFETERVRDPRIPGALAELRAAVLEWKELWSQPKRPLLFYRRIADGIEIDDRRVPSHPQVQWLGGQEATLYELCSDTALTVTALAARLREVSGNAMPDSVLRAEIVKLAEMGLMIEDEGRLLSIALPVNRNW